MTHDLSSRHRSVTAHFSPREYVLLVGLANIQGISIARLVADLATAAVIKYNDDKPGLLIQSAEQWVRDKEGE